MLGNMECVKKIAAVWFFLVVGINTVQPNPCDGDTDNSPPTTHPWRSSDLDESFYMLRVLRRTFNGERPKFHPPTVSVIPFAGEKWCRKRPRSQKSSRKSKGKVSKFNELPPVFTKSTCKSYLVLNHDPNRMPATVVEVRCACRHCQSLSGGRSRNDCKPIYNYRRMWRRKCNEKTKSYVDVKVLEPLVVGCTCVNTTEEGNTRVAVRDQ